MNESQFSIQPVLPFRLDLTAWALGRRPGNAVDHWDGTTYQRVLMIEQGPVLVSVTQDGAKLDITVSGEQLGPSVQPTVRAALDQLLGLSVRLDRFYAFAERESRLNRLVVKFRGLKPPRFPTMFEALANGITCQQLSLTVGIILLNRLAERFGPGFVRRRHAFPRPEDLCEVQSTELRPLGYSVNKGRALVELARGVTSRQVDLASLVELDDQDAVARLRQLRGIGRWTSEYVLLRGLGRIHVFPGDDVGARKSLERWLRLRKPRDYQGVRHVLTRWDPFGGLLYFHLLLDRLNDAGYLSECQSVS